MGGGWGGRGHSLWSEEDGFWGRLGIPVWRGSRSKKDSPAALRFWINMPLSAGLERREGEGRGRWLFAVEGHWGYRKLFLLPAPAFTPPPPPNTGCLKASECLWGTFPAPSAWSCGGLPCSHSFLLHSAPLCHFSYTWLLSGCLGKPRKRRHPQSG